MMAATRHARIGLPYGQNLTVTAINPGGETIHFPATIRVDTPQHILCYQHSGILRYVLRQLAGKA